MKFLDTGIDGAFVVEPEPRADDRGIFARIFCRDEVAGQGVDFSVEQANLSTSHRAGTLRGLHYQIGPSQEAKLVRAARGALFDVVVDLRRKSPTFGHWYGIELTAGNRLSLLVPEGCGHGFQTLVDDTDALYLVTAAYDPESERGLHHADQTIGISWPLPVTAISEKDADLPSIEAAELP